MSAEENLNPQQFFHGTSGEHSFRPGDILTPEEGRMRHVYYTSSLDTANTYASYAQPKNDSGRIDWDADAIPGHVYQVQPETKSGRKIGKHADDPYSGMPGNKAAYRTKSRLRVLHEVDRKTGEPL